MSALRALVLFVFLAAALVSAGSSLAASEEPAEQPEGIAKLVSDLKASGCKTVAVVVVKDALTPSEQEALLAQATEAGLSVVLKVVDLGSAEDLAVEIERVCQSNAEAIFPLGDPRGVEAILQQMRNVAARIPALLYQTEDGATKLVKRGVMPVFDTVLDLKRPSETDLVFLKNGDKLTGTVLNASITMRTPYASNLEFETRLIAGILFEGEAHMETVFTVNANRFSGFIDDPAVVFKPAEGPQMTIRKDKISKIVFRTRENELGGIQRNDLIVLNNGDVMSGLVLNKVLNVMTTPASAPIETHKVAHIAVIGGENALTTVRLRETGDEIKGVLQDEDIEVDLDCGPVIKVYQDRIKEIGFQKGYGTELSLEGLEIAQAALVPPGAKEISVDLGNNVKMAFVLVSPGAFLMGSKDGDADEKPVHKVTITKAFYMGKYEVTCEQWNAVMGSLPEETGEPDDPVANVSWNDCQEFIKRLNQEQPRYMFRLPTEAEWEYACRAGSKTQYCFGDDENGLDEYAWHSANSGVAANPVGRKKPNAWGLHDMHGNVWEWCQDWKAAGYYIHSSEKDPAGPPTADARVIRGGSWFVEPGSCRSANRSGSAPEYANLDLGFRVVVVSR